MCMRGYVMRRYVVKGCVMKDILWVRVSYDSGSSSGVNPLFHNRHLVNVKLVTLRLKIKPSEHRFASVGLR